MFAPLAGVPKGLKRGAEGVPEAGANDDKDAPASSGELQCLMRRLLLQREAARLSAARDDDVALALREDQTIEVALETGPQECVKTGKAGREGDDFKGHPVGRMPNALLKMTIFRIAEVTANGREKLMKTMEQGPYPIETAEAVGVLEK
ncbi:unnamed protein product [Prorocentrum cordatum]|uniref:Peptidylprolyl isomerase n=1 Tax=Prorocentrum cordatum TaxID=2364126 RepID=A0ABN9VLP7_9DINO|nr:unnamed protein product [Polarella glacialis]